jgi:hypothetical protein
MQCLTPSDHIYLEKGKGDGCIVHKVSPYALWIAPGYSLKAGVMG